MIVNLPALAEFYSLDRGIKATARPAVNNQEGTI